MKQQGYSASGSKGHWLRCLTSCRVPNPGAKLPWLLVLLFGGGAGRLHAQASRSSSSASAGSGPASAVQVPLSGKTPGGGNAVYTQQTLPSGGTDSAVVLQNSVTVQPPYDGSTPQGAAGKDVLPLTLADALARGLRYNLAALGQTAAVERAEGEKAVARSALLPSLNTSISENFDRVNLRSEGVSFMGIPTAVKFNYFDARVQLTQSVVDLVRLRNVRGATESVKASIAATRDSRDLVVLAVGGAYLQMIATQARVEATLAQVKTSQAIYQQARDRFDAGLVAHIDVSRSQVQLQIEQERLRSLRADFETQKLRLAREVGLALGQQFLPTDVFRYSAFSGYTLETALGKAFKDREDLKAAAAAVKAAEYSEKAARAERLPSVGVNANFGAAGVTPTNHSTGVYVVSGTLSVPIYEGGRIKGEIAQADAAVRTRRAEYESARGQVDQDVRQAFIDLDAATDQVGVANSNVALAHETLTQSQDRFVAGVADSVEVVQSEQTVVQADDDYITAVYEHNLAKVALARAMGNAEQTLPQFLKQ